MGWNKSDKLAVALACVGVVVAIALYWLEKTPTTAAVSLAAIVLLMIFPVMHFLPSLRGRTTGFSLVLLLTVLFGWVIWPLKMPHSADTAKTTQEIRRVVPATNGNDTQAAQPKRPAKKRAETAKQGHIHGTDNTVVGQTPIQNIEGNGNTIVGATDANGNTILNKGGTACWIAVSVNPIREIKYPVTSLLDFRRSASSAPANLLMTPPPIFAPVALHSATSALSSVRC
jgi:Ca2+/Na+ antiporter